MWWLLVAATDPEAIFQRMEAALLADPPLLEAQVSAEGSFTAELTVKATLGPKAQIDAEGTLLGRPASVHLASDGREVRWGKLREPQTATFSEGLILSFTRLGLLKDLIWIAGGQPPEGHDGAIRAWLTVSNFTLGPPQTVGGVSALTLRYQVAISGEVVGDVELTVDPTTARPLTRVATVQFQGTMRYQERYRFLSPRPKSK